MRLFSKLTAAALTALITTAAPQSCSTNEVLDDSTGELRLHFSEASYIDTKALSEEIPDTSEFLLEITGPDGESIYSGTFGDSPESIPAKAGTYYISVRSGNFSRPAFSFPLFGDEQCVSVSGGRATDVWLTCGQINSGVRLLTGSDFLTSHPDGVLVLKAENGSLMYSYSEKRTAYFNPGNVSLVLSEDGNDRTLFTRVLKAREILTVRISAPSTSSSTGGFHIQIDTARIWTEEDYTIGGGHNSGSETDDAMSVAQAKENIGAENVWIYGYIVGGDLTSSGISFEGPFKSGTNIAIASRTSVSSKESCMSVQLPKGDVRDALNLVDNPSNLKRKVYIKGDIVEAYYGIPGIKNISDFVLK
ncbi:MAG: DUF6359 domain-containing protein [Candidatus Cryptobacteroides sp.]